MDNRFNNISMNGRMAYVIMCVESYLVNVYPQKDWRIVSTALWEATKTNWADWTDLYSGYIPEIIFQYKSYDREDLASSFTEDDYRKLLEIYSDITEGREDDPSDELNYVLNKPYELAMVYEGTSIGDGIESVNIIQNIEDVLNNHGLSLPDIGKISFSSFSELNGWGNDFDGSYLSIILNT